MRQTSRYKEPGYLQFYKWTESQYLSEENLTAELKSKAEMVMPMSWFICYLKGASEWSHDLLKFSNVILAPLQENHTEEDFSAQHFCTERDGERLIYVCCLICCSYFLPLVILSVLHLCLPCKTGPMFT